MRQDSTVISRKYLSSIDVKTAEPHFVRPAFLVKVLLSEGHHTTHTAQIYGTISGYIERILIDGGQRKAVFFVVVPEDFALDIKDRKALVRDK